MADINLLIVARRLVGLSGHTERFRPLSGRYSGNIVIVIEPDDVFTAEDFVSMDVEGLLLAGAGIDRVSECIDTVCRGGMWLDPDIRGSIGTAQSSPPAHRKLSTREQQVARLAAEGLSNKRIARALQVSDGTVKMHMHHIITKLKLSNRYDLVRLAHCFPAGAAGLNGLKPVPVDAGGQTQAQIIPLRQY